MRKRPSRCYGVGRGDRLVRSRRVTSRPRSAPLRLGEGELSDPFGEEARKAARLAFLDALDRLAPEVAADLAEHLRPFLPDQAKRLELELSRLYSRIKSPGFVEHFVNLQR